MLPRRMFLDNMLEDLEKEVDQLKSIIKNKEKIIHDKNDEITMLSH